MSYNNLKQEDLNLLSTIIVDINKNLIAPLHCFDKISIFLNYLIEKNKELNLMSRKLEVKTIITDHIYDCLVGFKYFVDYSSITDIGSGSGLPGILLAIVFPEKQITLIDKSPKKTDFLKTAIKLLDLKNTKVICNFVNQVSIESEIITCRAFKEIPEILSMTSSFLNNNGTYILYKGRLDKINEELSLIKNRNKLNIAINKIEEIKDKERHVVVITKK